MTQTDEITFNSDVVQLQMCASGGDDIEFFKFVYPNGSNSQISANGGCDQGSPNDDV